MNITQEELQEYVQYDLDIGEFIWKKKKGKRNIIGSIAGCVRKDGYKILRFNDKLYLVHRLVWLYIYGVFPKSLDHIDGNPSNNRIDNLRITDQATNMLNSRLSKANNTGIKGIGIRIDIHPSYTLKYVQARTTYLGKVHAKLFKFVSEDEKKAALIEAEKWVRGIRESLHGEFINHGV